MLVFWGVYRALSPIHAYQAGSNRANERNGNEDAMHDQMIENFFTTIYWHFRDITWGRWILPISRKSRLVKYDLDWWTTFSWTQINKKVARLLDSHPWHHGENQSCRPENLCLGLGTTCSTQKIRTYKSRLVGHIVTTWADLILNVVQ